MDPIDSLLREMPAETKNNMKKLWFVPVFTAFTKAIFLLSILLVGAVEAATDTFTASGTWTAPAGVTSVDVEVWGGGGAGGGQNQNSDGGGGGGGGAYSKVLGIAVIPGNAYTVTVGAGGAGVVAGTGGAGGDSYFINTATVMAKGGAGGAPSTGTPPAAAAGGAAGAGVGTTKFSGGNGGQGRNNSTGRGGAGGSSAGTAANGTSGPTPWSTATAAAAPAGGGIGGNGGNANGQNGFAPASGNGGGGGGSAEGTNRVGGAGAGGKVAISYATAPTAPTVTTNAATSVTATGGTLNGTGSSNGASTTVTFDYGLTTGYGSSATAAQSPLVAGASGAAVSAAVSGLACNTLYHFRVKGVNSAGTTNGNDLTFTTSACPPQVTVTPATGGSAIAQNTAPGCDAAGWTALTGPVIAETVAGQVGTGNIVLTAPAGFEFNTAVPVTIWLTGNSTASRNINNLARNNAYPVTTITATAITFTVFEVGTRTNSLTWQGIQVRPTASAPLASGNITHTGTSAIAGVTGATNFGTLTEVASTPACLGAPTAPTVTTNAATSVTATGGTLNGTGSSNGASTTVTFDYGLTTGYGSSATAAQSPLVAGASGAAVSAAVSGLACNTLYHFRVKGVNSAGTTNGNDLTFTTSACPPQVTVTPATGGSAIAQNTAPGCDAAGWTALTGPVIAETVAGQVGTGNIVLTAPAGFEFNTAVPVTIWLTGNSTASRNINNLARNNAYPVTTITATAITFTVFEVGTRTNSLTWQGIQVRPTASAPLASGNITHTGTSAIAGVTGATNFGTLTEVASSPVCTAATAPTVTTNAATALTASGATLNGTVSSNGAITTVTFDYGLTTGYGSSATAAQSPLAAGASGAAVSAAVTGLACNTLYHFRVKGVNIAGTTNGSDGTFTTAACIPTATTNAASGITTPNNGTSWSATLNGIVSSNGAATTVTFEYGLTAAYGTSIAATPGSLAADAVNTAVSATLDGLTCNTTFHYRVKATSSAGTGNGSDGIFTTGGCPLAPFPATDCAATRFGGDLGCTANDVNITNISLAPTVSQTSCVSGTPVTLDLDMTVNFASPDRWDVGIFIANDGKLPSLLPANGGASSCSVAVLPIVPETGSYTFPDLDGVPQGMADTCGDGNGAINGGTGSGVKRMTGVTIPCYATPDSLGKLFVPFVVSWDNQKSPNGGICTSNQYPVPNTTSKCNAPLSSVPINVVVMPKINKTHSGASFNPGSQIIYTITVFNDSGGTLQASFFKDPAVAYLAVTGLSCTPANGATCPIANNTVADMQGPTGIPIPSANLPNNSSLIFTVTGTLSGGIGQTISNTATVSIGLNTNSSTDSVTLGAASGSKSFAPDSITEDNNSLMTITFTNPTASAVTGVSFLDTYPAGLVNAASPGGSTTCGGTVTAIAGGNTLTFSGGTIPATGSCTVSVYVTSATANSYINSVSFTPGSIGSASATLMVNAAVYGGFNACDVAAIPNSNCTNITTSTTSHITTKIAGSSFNLDLVALKTDGTRQTNYNNKDVIVELLDASNNSGALDAYNCRSTWTTFTPPMTLSPNPTFVSNGLVTVGPFTVAEAYRDVRVRVTNVGGATRVGCSTDRFAIRPNSLVVIPTDDTWETAGIARPLTNTNVSGGNVHKAGRPFTLIATAMNAASVTTPNYDITVAPAATLSQCNPGTACTTSFGTFNLGAGSAASGVVTWSSATYSEVGAFDLQLADSDFASVDAADTPWPACSDVIDAYGNAQSRYVCGKASVGRFVPDHFGLTGSVVTRSDLQATEGQATPFTYMDEPMKLSLVVTAYNKNEGVTNNYAGSFAKLDAITLGTGTYWFNTGCTGSTQCMGLGAVNGATGLSSRLLVVGAGTYASVGDPSSSWIAGVGTLTVHAKLARKATVTDWPDPPNSLLDGPYDTLKFGGMPRDSEGVTLPDPASTDTHKVDLDATTGTTFASDPDGINERREIFQTAARFGRLWMGNACGSDKRDLTIPFRAEYWNGSVFITNSDDSLTSIAQANIGLGNHQPAGFNGSVNLTHIPAGPFSVVSGLGSFSLLKPTGTPAAGSVDAVFGLGSATTTNTSFNFSAAQPPATPQPPTAGANKPYLRGKWYGATYDRDPVARAAFGIYCGGGSGRGPIYIRESY